MSEFKRNMINIIRERYDLSESDAEDVTEELIEYLEGNLLYWNYIYAQWQYKI